MTNEMKKALQNYCEKNSVPYCEEIEIAADYIWKHRDFIPEALPAVAAEFQWTLQHNVDSYGCDWDWVYGEDGLDFILNDQFAMPEWATDRELVHEEFYAPTEEELKELSEEDLGDYDCYEKDYGPSNPWDAPGMKVSDFITGVCYF